MLLVVEVLVMPPLDKLQVVPELVMVVMEQVLPQITQAMVVQVL